MHVSPMRQAAIKLTNQIFEQNLYFSKNIHISESGTTLRMHKKNINLQKCMESAPLMVCLLTVTYKTPDILAWVHLHMVGGAALLVLVGFVFPFGVLALVFPAGGLA